MTAWVDLTQEQRNIYLAWEHQLRAVSGEMYRLMNDIEAVNDMYNSQILTILVELDDNTIVPNSSGLSGSQSLDSDAEAVAIQAHFQAYLLAYDTDPHRQLWTRAAGIGNTIG